MEDISSTGSLSVLVWPAKHTTILAHIYVLICYIDPYLQQSHTIYDSCLHMVLKWLRDAGLTLNENCEFYKISMFHRLHHQQYGHLSWSYKNRFNWQLLSTKQHNEAPMLRRIDKSTGQIYAQPYYHNKPLWCL